MSRIKIRKYQSSDARNLVDIYYHTIHKINIRDYTQDQVNAWAPASCLELDGWQKKWQKIPPIIATIDDKIVGFAEFENDGHIDCFYVHHQFQNKGVGSVLLAEIENQALQKNIPKIFAEVSVTAKQFFSKKSFKISKEQMKKIRGVELKNFLMDKLL